MPEFSALVDSYIAFIQVGGAYAHNYLPILKMLKMKTLIITDLDYNKDAMSMEEVKREDSKSTNATINYCYRLVHADREKDYSPTIKELYDFQVKGESVLYNGLVYLTFQDEKSTARTLEEAMLNIQIYLFGDRMQQIYKNYDGSFEERLKKFDTSDQLGTNFRSIGKIVSILNNIYNDASFKQYSTENNIDVVPDIMPQVIISSNTQECIYELQKEFPEILTLYLMNKEKYQEIGAQNLYNAYENMEKYSFGRKYSPTDILSDMSSDNPDILMKFLFLLNNIMSFYANENYGMVISLCKKESKYFDSSQFKIKKHTDKQRIKSKFDKIQAEYEKEGCLIRDIVECLFANGFIPEAVKNDFEESTEYQSVLDIKIIEVKNLARYLNMPHISTQHGVKGESHSSVIFMASDNNSTPNVRMYPFFELWSNLEFSLPQFETLFYSYNRMIEKVEAELGMKISELTAETHNKSEKNKAILVRYSNEVLEKYQGNILFDALCKDDFISYLAKQNVGNAKKIFKITKMEGILTAYKLFYVGCSRARKNLIVVVDAYKVNGFKEAFMNKMKEIGFSVFCK